jgi:hypothetical protein
VIRVDWKLNSPQPDDVSGDTANRLMHAAMRTVEDRYGPNNVGPWNDWDWGFINGKLSALRWLLGSEWDFLDT